SPPLGDLIRMLRVDDLAGSSPKHADSATIRNVRTVTSFSWVDRAGSQPAILVPGKPPSWTPQTVPTPLKEDSGSFFRDKNAARYPKHPAEPAVVASLAADPSLAADLDLFACGSTLGNLLRFVRGQDKTFRMLAYKVRNTVFLVRRENSPTELIHGIRGFGHTFPDANTTWESDVRGSVSHQRLVRYDFGGLDMLVRFEADGYMQPPSTTTKPPRNTTAAPAATTDLLTSSLATTSLSTVPPSPAPPSSRPPTLQITPAGTLTPHATLFDLKTRSIRTRLTRNHLADELPRLWATQIPTLVLAFHTSGLFRGGDIEIKDVRDDVTSWEEEHAPELATLAALLHWVRGVVAAESVARRGVEICHSVVGRLEVRAMLEDAGEVLSGAVRGRWEGGG
ncbi:hypothetical protein BT67DRAFT_362345, partial [Trichocladium antarcticum]